MFFDDGNSLRVDVIDRAVARLEALEQVIVAHMKGYKFVSSSLLFIYGRKNGQVHVDVRMIDFAHTLPPHDQRVTAEEVDYLYGFRNVVANLKLIRSAPEHRCISDGADSPPAS